MRRSGLWLVLGAVLACGAGCAPMLVGGAVAVIADEAIEQEQGGDGLF